MTHEAWEAMDGKKIAFASISTFDGTEYIRPKSGEMLTLHAAYMGDRTEVWIVHVDGGGREMARYNTRCVDYFTWADATVSGAETEGGNDG